ncbi:MAG TPA: DUF3099 domain-containing protein [Pseudonocardia sp.]|jgi:hypothetical protein|nr:DUF3099 domain-containing protein [Pseudonocardia sp.]
MSRESPPVITDAQPSVDDELRHRRRVYTVVMAIHLVGFAVGGALYEKAWLTGLIIIIVTGPLQWVAVILANAAPRRRSRALSPTAAASTAEAPTTESPSAQISPAEISPAERRALGQAPGAAR